MDTPPVHSSKMGILLGLSPGLKIKLLAKYNVTRKYKGAEYNIAQ